MASSNIPTMCRIVVYKLTEADAEAINRRRGHYGASRGAGIEGFIAHVGNPVAMGETFPMLITRAWGETPTSAVNGQVFLDGNDHFWVRSVSCGPDAGSYSWPGEGSQVVSTPAEKPAPKIIVPTIASASHDGADDLVKLTMSNGTILSVAPAGIMVDKLDDVIDMTIAEAVDPAADITVVSVGAAA